MPILSMRVAIVTPVISRTYVFQAELLMRDVQHVFETELEIALVNGPSKATAAVDMATVVGCLDIHSGAKDRSYRPFGTPGSGCDGASFAGGVEGTEPTAMGPVFPVELTGLIGYVFDKINSEFSSML